MKLAPVARLTVALPFCLEFIRCELWSWSVCCLATGNDFPSLSYAKAENAEADAPLSPFIRP